MLTANHRIVVSEEDLLGLHLTLPIEKEFFDFSIKRSNLATRNNQLVEVFISFSPNIEIH